MSRERHDAGPDEHSTLIEFDRELQDALSVSPAPDFEARVLQTIAVRSTMRTPRRWGYGPLAAAAVVVLGTVLTVLMLRQGEEQPLRSPLRSTASTPESGPAPNPGSTGSAGATPPAPAPFGRRSRASVARTARHAARSRPPAVSEPEVIVPRDQAEAIHRLVRAISEGTLRPPALHAPTPTAAPEWLPVQPLVIEPIFVSAVEDRGEPSPGVYIR